MADNLDSNFQGGSDPGRLLLIEKARGLIDAALDGRLTEEQRQTFEQMVVADPFIAELYVEMVHLSCCIPFHVSRAVLDMSSIERDLQGTSVVEMHDTMILPALRESDFSDADFDPLLPGPSAVSASSRIDSNRKWWFGGSAAAILILGISAVWLFRGRQVASTGSVVHNAPNAIAAIKPPAIVTATAALDANQPVYENPGTALAVDQIVRLADSAVEVTFASGAVAVVRGPAEFRIVGQNEIALQRGSIALHVPPQAIGFRLVSPGLSVVDRGTNFGVRSFSDNAASEVHVFGGKVDVSVVDAAGRPTAPVVQLLEGNALRHEDGAASPLVPVVFAPATFTRDISQVRSVIHLNNTGDQAKPGSADPNWLTVGVPDDPNWKARPAMIPRDLQTIYVRYVSAESWIAVNSKIDDQAVGIFTFRTAVDLTGFDSRSVSISANVAADDYVSDIQVNGVSTGLSNVSNPNVNGRQRTELAIPVRFWHPGINSVDVLVMNKPITFKPNWVALHVDWTASGLLEVRR